MPKPTPEHHLSNIQSKSGTRSLLNRNNQLESGSLKISPKARAASEESRRSLQPQKNVTLRKELLLSKNSTRVPAEGRASMTPVMPVFT